MDMDVLEVIASSMFGGIVGVIVVVVFWQIIKLLFPRLKKTDLL